MMIKKDSGLDKGNLGKYKRYNTVSSSHKNFLCWYLREVLRTEVAENKPLIAEIL